MPEVSRFYGTLARFLFVGFFLLCFLPGCSPKKESLVTEIASVNEMHHQFVGFFSSQESEQYRRYLKLSSSSTTEELLQLTKHPNLVVRGYAGWGLIDRKYEKLDEVFKEFLAEKMEVVTFSGCLKTRDTIASEFYHRYWNSVPDEQKATDALLLKLDEQILNGTQVDWLLVLRALGNRKYPVESNPRIERLAFEELDKNAIFYLLKWYPEEYRAKARVGLLAYLNRTDFKTTGLTDYYEVVEKLLSFGDPETKQAVVAKLRTDRFWTYAAEQFIPFLKSHGIEESSVSPPSAG